MDLGLTGKRAIVTGGSRGIGRAVARALSLEGAAVGLAARDPERLSRAARELSAESGAQVVGRSCDTRDDASVQAMVDHLAGELGGVDILVNAAARPSLAAPPPWSELTGAALWEEVDTKVMGYLRCIRAVVPHMRRSGWGRIVNVSGLAARQATSVVGSVRNVAVSAMTKVLADELGADGINVTVVHPGLTRTEAMPDELAALGSGNLIGRIVEAEEVAWVVAFLASPCSVAITGDAVACGGGVRGAIHY